MNVIKKTLLFLVFLFCTDSFAVTHSVTNTSDSGAGSLRQAILDANADGTTPRTINFSIGSGVQTISPLTQLPTLTVSDIIIDGSSQPGWSAGNPVIVIDGTNAAFTFDGLVIQGTDNCTIQDLVINNGFNNGLTITGIANDNAIYGCFIGTDQTGNTASPNSAGINISAGIGEQNNNTTMGAAGRGNVVSGNAGFFGAGIVLTGNIHNAVVQGSFLGTDKTGTIAIPNAQVGIGIIDLSLSGVVLCNSVLIGGPNPGEGNVISGQGPGVFSPIPGIAMVFQNIINTTIQGNKIGTDITGQLAVPNDLGIVTFTNIPTTIENTLIKDNIISGNRSDGAALQVSVNRSVIQGNFIGTDATGTLALGNGGNGMRITGTGNVVGGTNSGDFNLFSANSGAGLSIEGANDSIVQGNFIGTDASGTIDLGNGGIGISIYGNFDTDTPSLNNLIGGTFSNEKNIVKFNDDLGVLVDGLTTIPSSLNSILGNTLFLNTKDGIFLNNNGNNLQEPPTLLSADYCPTNSILIVTITAPVNPGASLFRLEVFVNSIDRTPITEGERFIGAVNSVPSSATVTQAFYVPGISVGQWVSATATNMNGSGGTFGDTSPFTPNLEIQAATSSDTDLSATPTILCFGASSVLTLTITGAGPYSLTWSDGLIQSNATSPVERIVTPEVTTAYSVLVTDTYGCTTTSNSVIVTVNQLPSVTLTATPPSTLPGGTVTLTATPSGDGPFTLTWSDGLVQPGVVGPVSRDVEVNAPITYSVTVINSNGCVFGPVFVDILIGKISPIAQAILDKYCSFS